LIFDAGKGAGTLTIDLPNRIVLEIMIGLGSAGFKQDKT
jgi:hypothetical protein